MTESTYRVTRNDQVLFLLYLNTKAVKDEDNSENQGNYWMKERYTKLNLIYS